MSQTPQGQTLSALPTPSEPRIAIVRETGWLIENEPETVLSFEGVDTVGGGELLRHIASYATQRAATKRQEAKARRILKGKAIGTGVSAVEIRLRRNGPGRYVLADHIGVPNDTPQNVTIDDMIEWLQSQPAKARL